MSIIQGTSKAAGGAGYEIDQSIRFDKTTSSHLSKTYGSAGNRRTWTFSTWFKRGKIDGTRQSLFAATGTAYLQVGPDAASREMITILNEGSGTDLNWYTTQVFRDPSAWYHLVWQFDSTQATADNRTKLYINGVQVTDFTKAATPAQNFEGAINNAVEHKIGEIHIANYYFDGYQAEINFIDGTALDPTSFGEYNDDGVWIPKAYSGAYGTNGFYITGETAGDLGEDFSGNGNDFTSSGLATTDQMLDTPTLNYPTLNSAVIYQSGLLLSDGNLDAFGSSGSHYNLMPATMQIPSTGKWAFECTILSSSGYIMIGFASAEDINNFQGSLKYFSLMQNAGWLFNTEVAKKVDGSSTLVSGLGSLTTNDVVECMIDNDAGTMTFLKNGSAYASLSGLNPLTQPAITVYTNGAYRAKVDFGQIDYVPSDASYSAINSSTLPTPSVTDGSAHFQSALYTGTTGAQDITFSGNSDLAPDWLWFKARSAASNHFLFDKVRGALKKIESDRTAAEATSTGSMTAFGTDGFSLGDGGSANDINGVSGTTYVAWGWAAGNSAGSSNSDGSITSTVTANTTAGFSVAKWTGSGANATIGHGLGAAPKMILVKNLADADSWVVYHEDVGATKGLTLDTTAAAYTASTFFNNTAPTSSVFSVGSGGRTNGSSDGMIAYCFAEIPGYSSFGSYTGNSSTDGPFVYTGFKPAFIMTKRTDSTSDWTIEDTTRSTFNLVENALFPNLTSAEDTTGDRMDILSNGFKLRTTAQPNVGTLIYMAFAENPFGGDGAAPATAR